MPVSAIDGAGFVMKELIRFLAWYFSLHAYLPRLITFMHAFFCLRVPPPDSIGPFRGCLPGSWILTFSPKGKPGNGLAIPVLRNVAPLLSYSRYEGWSEFLLDLLAGVPARW